jgi:hypothetical protein
MLAILLGLSWDHEVFLVSQIEEHVHAGQDNKQSVVSGLVIRRWLDRLRRTPRDRKVVSSRTRNGPAPSTGPFDS